MCGRLRRCRAWKSPGAAVDLAGDACLPAMETAVGAACRQLLREIILQFPPGRLIFCIADHSARDPDKEPHWDSRGSAATAGRPVVFMMVMMMSSFESAR